MTVSRDHVRALILGSTLSQVRFLGLPEGEITKVMFQVGHPDPQLAIVTRLYTLSVAPSYSSDLESDVADVCERARNNVLNLLVDLECDHCIRAVSSPAFPLEFLLPPNSPNDPVADEGPDLADCHLHSGGAMRLYDLIGILVSSEHNLFQGSARGRVDGGQASEAVRVWGTDSNGDAFSIPVLLGAVRLHLLRIAGVAEWQVGRPLCAELFATESFWHNLANAVREFRVGDELTGEILAGGAGILPEPNIRLILKKELEAVRFRSVSARSEFVGLIQALNLLSTAVASTAGEGLRRFVERFTTAGEVRSFGGGDDKSRAVEASCRSVYVSSRVKAAEFRKTIRGRGMRVGEVEETIRANLAAHLVGVGRFASDAPSTIRFGMPVGFLREQRGPTVDHSRWTARYDLMAVGAVARALCVSFEGSEVVREFVNGCDVAGDERSMEAWPFLAAMEGIRARLGEGFRRSFHSGESFSWRLQGLRSLDGVVRSSANVHSVGHALVLDDVMSSSITRQWPSNVPILQAILDVCWLIHREYAIGDATELLGQIVADSPLSVVGVGPEDLSRGSQALLSSEGLTEVGILREDGFVGFNNYEDDWIVKARPKWHLAAWILSHYSPGDDLLRGSLNRTVEERFRNLARATAPECAADVRDYLIARDVLVEVCPTSNLRLAGVGVIDASHVARFKGAGVRMSVNSDDPIIFDTDVVREWRLVADAFGHELASELASNSLRACTASPRTISIEESNRLIELMEGGR